jgi:hypothetical protein
MYEKLLIAYCVIAAMLFSGLFTSHLVLCACCGDKAIRYTLRILVFSVFWPAGIFWVYLKGFIDDKRENRRVSG